MVPLVVVEPKRRHALVVELGLEPLAPDASPAGRRRRVHVTVAGVAIGGEPRAARKAVGALDAGGLEPAKAHLQWEFAGSILS